MKPSITLALLLILAVAAFGQTDQPQPSIRTTLPDMTDMEAPQLQQLCRQLYARVALLEDQVADLKKAVAAGKSGTPQASAGNWTVMITQNMPPDIQKMEADIADCMKRLAAAQANTQTAQAALAQAQSASRPEIVSHPVRNQQGTVVGHDTHWSQVTSYSDSSLQGFAQILDQRHTEQAKVENELHDLRSDLDNAKVSRIANGLLSDMTAVLIKARGTGMVTAAEKMEVGKRYLIEGTGSHKGTTLQIVPTSIVMVL